MATRSCGQTSVATHIERECEERADVIAQGSAIAMHKCHMKPTFGVCRCGGSRAAV